MRKGMAAIPKNGVGKIRQSLNLLKTKGFPRTIYIVPSFVMWTMNEHGSKSKGGAPFEVKIGDTNPFYFVGYFHNNAQLQIDKQLFIAFYG